MKTDILIVVVGVALFVVLWIGWERFSELRSEGSHNRGPVACTADAKLCPDGSAVGRIPPNCEFAKCPGGR